VDSSAKLHLANSSAFKSQGWVQQRFTW